MVFEITANMSCYGICVVSAEEIEVSESLLTVETMYTLVLFRILSEATTSLTYVNWI